MDCRTHINELLEYLDSKIIGQKLLNKRLLMALLADGHLLVEGAPGLAKTRAIKALASGIEADFHRIQFTPDLLPSDIVGTEIFRPQASDFVFRHGPVFHNLVLADEINRSPAKVQSALLEAMGERQVTVGDKSYELPPLFMVMATQNPIEHEGTYSLPEAQLDRFLMHVYIDYPDVEAETKILQLVQQEASIGQKELAAPAKKMNQETLFAARTEVLGIHMQPAVEQYIVQLVMATRYPHKYDESLKSYLEYGASPRGTIALCRLAKANAWLAGRDFVTPQDVQEVCGDALRHRIGVSFEAEANGFKAHDIIKALLNAVVAP